MIAWMLTCRRTSLSNENINSQVSSPCLLTASDATHLSQITEAAVATTQILVAPTHALGEPLCPTREAPAASAAHPCARSEGPRQPTQAQLGARSLISVPEMLLCTSVPLAASLGSPFLTCPAPSVAVPGPAASLQAKLRQLQGSRQRTMHFPSLCPVMVRGNTAPLGARPARVLRFAFASEQESAGFLVH